MKRGKKENLGEPSQHREPNPIRLVLGLKSQNLFIKGIGAKITNDLFDIERKLSIHNL